MKIVRGSFVAIVAKDARPYKDYPSVEKRVADMEIPVILMLNRWDGKIGFPGGHIEKGETPVLAAIREAKEEINLDLSEHLTTMDYVCKTHHIDDKRHLETHLIAHFVSYEELKNIARDIMNAEHFGSEATGFVFVQCVNSRKGGYSEFLKNNFPHTAKEQLETLVRKYDLLVADPASV